MGDTALADRYHIIRHLGGGGFGQTYVAQDRQLPGNPLCVVKQFKPQGSDPASLELARRFFNQEAEVLYRLGVHEQIPELLAHFEESREFYLVQEFIEGENLSHELLSGKRLGQSEVVTLLQSILKILEFVHQEGVIHRDIKPENLIRQKQDGRLFLIDFGAVKQLSHQAVQTGHQSTYTVIIGSAGYMPVEQLSGKPRFSSDLYAVGIIGIQALTGVSPTQLREDLETNELIWRDLTQVSPAFGKVLETLVRYDFRQRYQSATEVLQALAKLGTPVTLSQKSTIKSALPQAAKPTTLPGEMEADLDAIERFK